MRIEQRANAAAAASAKGIEEMRAATAWPVALKQRSARSRAGAPAWRLQ